MFVLGDGCTKRSYYKGGKLSQVKLGEGVRNRERLCGGLQGKIH
jgi:hypothetical protein